MTRVTAIVFLGLVNLVANPGFEEGTQHPDHWDRCDGLTSFWEKDPVRGGKCIRLNSRVANDEFHARLEEMKQENPPPPKEPRPLKDPAYDSVGGNDGVSYWSDWIEVKPGARYRLSVDVRSEGGTPKVFVKGYAEMPFDVEEDGKAKHVLMRKVAYKVFLDAPGGREWRTSTLDFCPTRDRDDVKWIRVMLYAYWPPQNYWFDNISVVESGTDAEAPARWAAKKKEAADTEARDLEAKRTEARLTLERVRKALDRYARDLGAPPPSLKALHEDPGDERWAGPYLLELGDDPWGHPYHYERTEKGYSVRSYGPDGEPGGGDDVE
ncbi:MAG TPA: type II secretion system protein GspG [Planctomycetota bacterium]|nr:type II secretion system protein GspG [Planctomycetota bacterium]